MLYTDLDRPVDVSRSAGSASLDGEEHVVDGAAELVRRCHGDALAAHFSADGEGL